MLYCRRPQNAKKCRRSLKYNCRKEELKAEIFNKVSCRDDLNKKTVSLASIDEQFNSNSYDTMTVSNNGLHHSSMTSAHRPPTSAASAHRLLKYGQPDVDIYERIAFRSLELCDSTESNNVVHAHPYPYRNGHATKEKRTVVFEVMA